MSEAALAPLRARIDAIDSQLVAILAERMACVDEVVALKRQHGLPARIDDRIEAVVARVRDKASEVGAPPELAELLWRTMIDWVIAFEVDHLVATPNGEQPA